MADNRPVLINLFLRERRREKRLVYTFTAALSAVIFLGSLAGLYYYALAKQDQEVRRQDELRAKNQEIGAASANASSSEVLPEQLAKKFQQVGEIEEQSPSYINLIAELEKYMPRGLWVEGIAIEDQQLTCKGFVEDYDELVQLTAGLRTSPVIKNVWLAFTESQSGGNEIEFQLSAEWSRVQK